MPNSNPTEVARNERLRRFVNISVAAIGITLTAPLMLVVALLVRLESRGPAIYKQPRVGLDRRGDRGAEAMNHRRSSDRGGLIFTIYKFRTMTLDRGGAVQKWATKDDSRITRLGRLLRATRIDELPQLFNVMKGDMNIVGPRPEQPNIFRTLREEIHGYSVRQRVRPGITGLAQVSQHYDRSLADVQRKVAYDLEYIVRRSLRTDFEILLRTIPTVLLKRGAW